MISVECIILNAFERVTVYFHTQKRAPRGYKIITHKQKQNAVLEPKNILQYKRRAGHQDSLINN